MEDMWLTRPPRLQEHKTRHGQKAWYVRPKGGKLIRIKGEYGSEDFERQYIAALAGQPLATKAKPNSNSLQWLYDRYRESRKWSDLSSATRRQRENILNRVMVKSGQEPFKAIDASDIEAGLDTRKDTPAQARNYLDAMQGLFRWAKKNDQVDIDPTASVERPKRAWASPGFEVWEMGDVDAYRKKWPVGTRERVWFEVLFGTGLRRGDAVKAGKQHIGRDGVFSLATEKTGMVMHCTIEAPLKKALKAGPTADLAFICGERGEPLTKESFGNMFRKACNDAGIKKSAHGIRKLAATIDAERGYTERELEAKYGWTGGYMASLYTKSANRKRMAVDAAKRSRVLPDRARVLPAKSKSKYKDLQATKGSLVRSRNVT